MRGVVAIFRNKDVLAREVLAEVSARRRDEHLRASLLRGSRGGDAVGRASNDNYVIGLPERFGQGQLRSTQG